MSAHHIIRKAIVELTVPPGDDAFMAQVRASAFFKTEIYPMLERILDELDVDEDIIRLEKLELDLKHFRIEQDNASSLIKLEQQIREKLEKIIKEIRNSEPGNRVVANNKRVASKNTRKELFFYILRTGTLPWWAEQDKQLSLNELAEELLKNEPGTFRDELISVLRSEPARKRMLRLPEKVVKQFIGVISGQIHKTLLEVLNFIKELPCAAQIERSVYLQALSYSGSAILTPRSFIAGILKEIPDMEIAGQLYIQSRNYPKQESDVNDITVEVKRGLADADNWCFGKIKKMFTPEDIWYYFSSPQNSSDLNSDEETKDHPEKTIHLPEDKKRGPKNNSKEDSDSAEEDLAELILKGDTEAITRYFKQQEEQEITYTESEAYHNEERNTAEYTDVTENNNEHYIRNAGLVILNPYLSAFFKELGLCNGKEFISQEASERAAHLLQYLATGSEGSFEEHDMLLNKILCGIAVETPFTIDFTITDKEKQECKDLLDAAASNWTALKGTSGESMRDAFFMREGILEQQANGWNLKIEKTTIDILIDKLPWGISIVKLPWTKAMIFVNW